MTKEYIERKLQEKNQTELLRFYDELTEKEKEALLSSVEKIDWEYEKTFLSPANLSDKGKNITPIDGLKVGDIEKRKDEFEKVGINAIRQGKLACVLLAGGQGTRLGFDAPKGAFNIGVNKTLYIFEQQVKNMLEVVKKTGVYPYLFIMTSEQNDAYTKAFWKEHDYFGYDGEKVDFFVQDTSPAVSFDGKIYLEEKDKVALSPNGNGGWYASMCKNGLKEKIKTLGIEWINVYAVDNVLQKIADPVFLGATIVSQVNCGAKVVCKAYPEERVGVLCKEDEKPTIIEYYELTEEMANAREKDGSLSYIFGVILNYLFKVEKMDETLGKEIPVHRVKKKIPYVDENGNKIRPETENGYKFETLAVDLVKMMDSVLPFEVEREKEFAPVKNKTGVDSVESARVLLQKNGIEI